MSKLIIDTHCCDSECLNLCTPFFFILGMTPFIKRICSHIRAIKYGIEDKFETLSPVA